MPKSDEELRSAGWEESAIREYRRGYEAASEAGEKFRTAIHPGAIHPNPEQLPAFTVAQMPRVIAKGDRGTWMRNTPAGMLAAVVSPDEPDDAARELAAARAFIDDYEFRYGRRPAIAEAQLAVRRQGGLLISGTVAEIGKVFAMAGLRFGIQAMVEPLPDPGQAIVASARPG